MRILIVLMLCMTVNTVMAGETIHAVIGETLYLTFGETSALAKKLDTIDDFKGYDFSFPKKQYIDENISLVYKDKAGNYKTIFAKGTLDLISHNPNNGQFAFKLTVDNLVLAGDTTTAGWSRSKTNTPIKGTFQFDSNHTNSTMITGKYDPSAKRLILTKNNHNFYIKHASALSIVLEKEREVPVTVTIE